MDQTFLVVVTWVYGGLNEIWVTEEDFEKLELSSSVESIRRKET
ncbi:hypothetical protein [Paenibacillus sinopodophylli]|nr:hypothetical protein [Paenibacillus sinopodophylli]